MSNDDPSDDALDANPSAGIGPVRHAPKLASPDDDEGNSRTVNLRDVRDELRAEREQRAMQDADYEQPPTEAPRRREQRRAAPPPQRSPLAALRPPSMPTNLGPYRSPLGGAPRGNEEAAAWDKYLIGALPLVIGLADDAEAIAAQIADRLLEERRARFG